MAHVCLRMVFRCLAVRYLLIHVGFSSNPNYICNGIRFKRFLRGSMEGLRKDIPPLFERMLVMTQRATQSGDCATRTFLTLGIAIG